jgi:hypothetical protein
VDRKTWVAVHGRARGEAAPAGPATHEALTIDGTAEPSSPIRPRRLPPLTRRTSRAVPVTVIRRFLPAGDAPSAPRARARDFDQFVGAIAAGGFVSGEQVVVGMWRRSPLGSFIDVMWVRADGERVLLAPSPEVAAFVSALYTFDRIEVVEIVGGFDGRRVAVRAGPLDLELRPDARGWRSWVFAVRPRQLRRSPTWLAIEDRFVEPLGRVLLGGAEGVRVGGVTPGGRREWYSVDDYRTVTEGTLFVDGRSAGELTELRPDLGVGLSAFPTRPAMVDLVTLIEPPR